MAQSRITFGEWLPDQPGLAGALTVAKNVYPKAIGYGPFAQEEEFSKDASEDLNNIGTALNNTGATFVFAGGPTKLFLLDSNDLSLDDVSGATYSTVTRWNFAQFGNLMLAASNSNRLQAYNMSSTVGFVDIDAGAPTARFVTVVRDFVVTGNQSSNRNRVQWSGINDATTWSSSQVTQSDFQDIPDGDEIRGLTGGEVGIILCSKSIHRMTYVGTPLIFQFDTVARNIGCYESNSVIQWRGITYFLGDDGFYATNGQTVEPIGSEKVDRYFFNSFSEANLSRMSVALDPAKGIVCWGFVSTDETYRLMIYHINTKRWSFADTTVSRVCGASSPAFTLESLDNISTSIDALGASLDSRAYAGGRMFFAGVRGPNIMSFTGADKTATIVSPDLGSAPISTMLTLVKPIVDNGSGSIAVASRFNLNEGISFNSSVAADAENRVGVRTTGKYHRIQLTPSGNWTTAIGVDVELNAGGSR
jgi:hypothetical protein